MIDADFEAKMKRHALGLHSTEKKGLLYPNVLFEDASFQTVCDVLLTHGFSWADLRSARIVQIKHEFDRLYFEKHGHRAVSS